MLYLLRIFNYFNIINTCLVLQNPFRTPAWHRWCMQQRTIRRP